jgi:hypothetical protein
VRESETRAAAYSELIRCDKTDRLQIRTIETQIRLGTLHLRNPIVRLRQLSRNPLDLQIVMDRTTPREKTNNT